MQFKMFKLVKKIFNSRKWSSEHKTLVVNTNSKKRQIQQNVQNSEQLLDYCHTCQ